MLGIIVVHTVMMTIFVFDMFIRQRDFLYAQAVAQTHSLAESLAASSVSWVLADDVAGLEEVIQSQQAYPHLAYAMVLSPLGRVIGHSDLEKAGLYIRDSVSLRLLKTAPRPLTLIQNSHLIDVAAPIMANHKLIGWARVAISQDHMARGLQNVTRDGVIYMVLAITAGAVFAFFMAGGLTKGLRHLVAVADSVRLGNRRLRSDIKRVDELGQLSEDFNAMLEALVENEHKISVAQKKLAQSEERFHLAMQGSNDGLWDWEIATDKVYYSSKWKSMLGYEDHEIGDTYDEWTSRMHPDDLTKAKAAIAAHLRGETDSYENIHRIRHRDGHWRWHLERGMAVHDAHGNAVRMVGTNSDITERKLAEDVLFEEKERALVTLHSIADAVITTDKEGVVNYLNTAAEQLTGWSNAAAMGKSIQDIFTLRNEITLKELENPVMRCLHEGVVVDIATLAVFTNRQGEHISTDSTSAPIRDRNAKIIGAVLVFHDVGETRELTRKMSWQATHDSLTGLLNRSEFERLLEENINEVKQDNKHHALLYLDLDQFKIVNDTCGHIAGDQLLKQIAFLLQEQIRESDHLARLGGDEFGVLLSGCPQQEAIKIALKLLAVVNEFRFVWQEKTFEIGVSIGLVQIDGNAAGITSVLSAADVACYAAKDLGRNRIHIYQPDDVEMAKRHSEMQWVSRITNALESGQFMLHRQAIRPIGPAAQASQEDEHIELLVRMLDEEGALVPPNLFIPAAERYNLMPSIDRWVVREAFAHMAAHPDAYGQVSINLSGMTYSDKNFHDYVRRQLQEYAVAAEKICFEITETAAITHLSQAVNFIREFRELGCRFSLDDFGSGLSSFAYLKNLPVDYLKIDGSFIKDMAHDDIDRAMVKAINEIGHVMGIKTIAEFVEDDEILGILVDIGVDYAQGYGIEVPRPLCGKPWNYTRSGST